jgi:hypothetical protein
MPPISSKRGSDGVRACEVVVDLAGDGALEAAHDVELGQALVGPPLDIGPGRWVAAHADQGDAPQGVVGAAVTSPVEAVAVGAGRGRRDRGGTTQMRKGRLRAEPLGHSARPVGASSPPAAGRQTEFKAPGR